MNAACRFRDALDAERPLHLVGANSAPVAMIARDAGFRAIYLSGSGVATGAFGLPDLGMTTMSEVCQEVRRITRVVETPLIVDADTGFGGPLAIERTIHELIYAGAAGCHIEDQPASKRCGHRPNKRIVAQAEMEARILAADAARGDDAFFLIARTDAFAQEGLNGAIERGRAYAAAGADALFPEAMHTLEDYAAFCAAVEVPVLASITEFGRTPLFSTRELADVGVRIVLNPLSIFRMILHAARDGFRTLRAEGTPASLVDRMMSRSEMYDLIGYHEFERRQDAAVFD
jgi:methylisocitrate lyase